MVDHTHTGGASVRDAAWVALEFKEPLQLGGPGEAVEQPLWHRTPPVQEAP